MKIKSNNPKGKPQTEHMSLSIARGAKFCISCGEYKNHSEFHGNNKSRDGVHPACKLCRNERNMQNRHIKARGRGENIGECINDDCGRLFRVFKSSDHKECPKCLRARLGARWYRNKGNIK